MAWSSVCGPTRPWKTPSATRRWCACSACRATGARARQRHPGQARGQQPCRFGEGPPGDQHDPRAEERGEIRPGDTLIEATSGNTGIALAMAAAIRGYRMVLIMPEDLSIERAQTMKAFGAELILTPRSGGMEYARDLAEQMQREGKGRVLDQFANADNPRVHYETTGPEIWADTQRAHHALRQRHGHHRHDHRGVALPEGAEPGGAHRRRAAGEGSRIPGIRKWPEAYLPKIYDPAAVDELVLVSQADAEDMVRRMAREEGLFAGISAAGAAGWRCSWRSR
jgi:cysteine synthase B